MCADNDEICDIVDYQKKFEILNTFDQDSRSEDVSAQFQYYGQCEYSFMIFFKFKMTSINMHSFSMFFQLQAIRKIVIIQVILTIQFVSNKPILQPHSLEILLIN